jgi:hypothetical protein
MISRKTAMAIGEAYGKKFTKTTYNTAFRKNMPNVLKTAFYDFLYENDYEAWFCNGSKNLMSYDNRAVKEYIMKLHTGETQTKATPSWTWDQRKILGQSYLEDLALDFLNYVNELTTSDHTRKNLEDITLKLSRNLELDGYVYRNNVLLAPESDVLDIVEEVGILESLFTSLGLKNKEIVLNHLNLSSKHYINGNWGDSITNSRNFLEGTLREVASTYSDKIKKVTLGKNKYESASNIRNYLEEEELLESKEKKVLGSVYSLLSNTGSHPYMADNDEARLLRHLALTLSQFVMLRLQGRLNNS